MIGWDLVNNSQMVKSLSPRVERELVQIVEAADGPDRGILRALLPIYERTRSWDAVAKSFFERDPDQTQADLRRLMALISADGRPTTAFTGEAHRLYHAYNPRGNNYGAH